MMICTQMMMQLLQDGYCEKIETKRKECGAVKAVSEKRGTMEEIKDYIFTGAIATVAFFGKWWFNKTEKKMEELEKRVAFNEKEIELNTQSDKDYRDNTSKSLDEIKQTQNEIYKLLISKS